LRYISHERQSTSTSTDAYGAPVTRDGLSVALSRTVGRGVAAAAAPTSLARVTFLFAGMITGVLIGIVALVPSVAARGRALLGAAASSERDASPVAVVPQAVLATSAEAPLVGVVVPPVRLPDLLEGPAPDQTLVTFLAAEKGQRVIVDGRTLASDEPLRITCGKHKVKVGHKKARAIDFPCGAALTLE
jgi:hypothetical protein